MKHAKKTILLTFGLGLMSLCLGVQAEDSQATSFWQSMSFSNSSKKESAETKTAERLSIKSEPKPGAKTIADLAVDQNFSVETSEWVKILTKDGKQGWVLKKDLDSHIQQCYNRSYQVTMHGNQNQYTVEKLSQAEVKKQWEAETRRVEKRWRDFHRSFFNPLMESDETSDTIEQLQGKVSALETEIKALKKLPNQ